MESFQHIPGEDTHPYRSPSIFAHTIMLGIILLVLYLIDATPRTRRVIFTIYVWSWLILPVGADDPYAQVYGPHSSQVAPIPANLTYLIPREYMDNPEKQPVISSIFSNAETEPFISYDPFFTKMIGWQPPGYQFINFKEELWAYQAGVWVWDIDEVWFTASTADGPIKDPIHVLNLKTNETRVPVLSQEIVNPNGAYYFKGLIYFTSLGNKTDPGGIFSVNPKTGETIPILNSYYGRRFNGINDLVWVYNPTSKKEYLFFTDSPLASLSGRSDSYELPDAVWRWDPQELVLRPVISRAEILRPYGISVNAAQNKLYVTEYSDVDSHGGDNSTSSPAIYEYTLDSLMDPINKKLLSLAKRGTPNGIHVDSNRYIWACERESIVVRNEFGAIIGEFNAGGVGMIDAAYVPLANFALAGNMLVILAGKRVYTLKLAFPVIDVMGFQPPGSYDPAMMPLLAGTVDDSVRPKESDVFGV